ncbi:MAG TPA: DsbA family protein [Bauldia sp.]|nr:DsbA family protein [Bauldia sp.]
MQLRSLRLALAFAFLSTAALAAATTDTAPAGTPGGATVETPAPGAPAGDMKLGMPRVQNPAELAVAGPLGDMAMGDPKAKVTIIEYASMTCPHCARVANETFPALKEKYIDTGKVYFIFREFPLDDLALAASMLARCAPPEKYFPTIKILFEMQENWAAAADPGAALYGYLAPMGFTEESFNSCLQDQKVLDGVTAVRDRAEQKFGVRGTPTFFFNGTQKVGELTIKEVDDILAPML